MSATKILCPTDFSPSSQAAVRLAVRMARDTEAELVLLHAWHIPPLAYSLEAPLPAFLVDAVVKDAERELDAAVKAAVDAGAKRTVGKLVSGPPWAQVIDELEKQPYDVCILGTRGRTGLSRVLLGSVAEKVVRHAPCSVLAVRPDGDIEPFHHALVPTDFSDSARHALDLAVTLVGPTGSITLLHVIEVPVAYAGEVEFPDFARDVDKRSTEALEKELARIRSTTTIPINARTRTGYAGAQTLAALESDRTVDLVVMGSHGRTGIRRALIGSVAEKVVRHARCSVFVARSRKPVA
jgi:nucleotide-binding universal stress UspA family protein